jgi:hypothetical protein
MPSSPAIPIVDAKLYYGSVGGAATTEADTVQDVSFKQDWDEAPANNRTSRAKGTLLTLYGLSLEISFLVDATDAHFKAFRAAAVAGNPLAVKVLSKAGVSACTFDANIKSLDDDQGLANAGTNKFSLTRKAGTRDPVWA